MVHVKLHTNYLENKAGDIIAVGNNEANGLEERGIGVRVKPQDFVKETNLGKTKAFESAPSQVVSRKKNTDEAEDTSVRKKGDKFDEQDVQL